VPEQNRRARANPGTPQRLPGLGGAALVGLSLVLSSFCATGIFQGNRGLGCHGMVGTSGATRVGSRLATPELEVGGIEGAGEAALLPPGMNPSDEALGELSGGHPDVRGYPRIFRRKFRSESSFAFCHSSAGLRRSTNVCYLSCQVSVGLPRT
jgi:hypothetical protein